MTRTVVSGVVERRHSSRLLIRQTRGQGRHAKQRKSPRGQDHKCSSPHPEPTGRREPGEAARAAGLVPPALPRGPGTQLPLDALVRGYSVGRRAPPPLLTSAEVPAGPGGGGRPQPRHEPPSVPAGATQSPDARQVADPGRAPSRPRGHLSGRVHSERPGGHRPEHTHGDTAHRDGRSGLRS